MLNRKRSAALVELCRNTLRLPSPSGREREVALLLQETMQAYGFDEVSIDRFGSVLGRISGRQPGPTVLLDGHIDTVDVPDPTAWSHDPYGAEVVEGRIYGRGSSDMKGSVCAMLSACAHYAEDTGRAFQGTLWVSCTVQEECFEGVSSREITRRVQPSFVIVGEATGLTLKIGQRGRAEVVVETQGIPCHSAHPEKGVNAVYHMCAVVDAIRSQVPEQHPVLGPGIYELTDIVSSPYPGASVVPGLCRATYDHRLLPGETAGDALAAVRSAIVQAAAGCPGLQAACRLAQDRADCWTGATIEAERFFPAWLLRPEDTLVQKALAGLKEMGIDAPLSHFSFCTNGSHFCGEAGIPTVGFGPSREDLAHTVDEYIEIEQLTRACEGFYGIIKALTR